MYEGIDTVILNEELAYQDVMPAAWLPGKPGPRDLERFAEGNLRLVQAALALQDQPRGEKSEENTSYSADIQRLDMKVNLLLDLMGRLLRANQPVPSAKQVRFNSHGAIVNDRDAAVVSGSEGVLEIHLLECLPEPLRLAGEVVGMAGEGAYKIKFPPLGETLSDSIEKLAFRRHRRTVAVAKQPKKA
jgi:hypothetical protein